MTQGSGGASNGDQHHTRFIIHAADVCAAGCDGLSVEEGTASALSSASNAQGDTHVLAAVLSCWRRSCAVAATRSGETIDGLNGFYLRSNVVMSNGGHAGRAKLLEQKLRSVAAPFETVRATDRSGKRASWCQWCPL